MPTDEDHLWKGRLLNIRIRNMEIDDLPTVFHLGEELFRAEKVPNA